MVNFFIYLLFIIFYSDDDFVFVDQYEVHYEDRLQYVCPHCEVVIDDLDPFLTVHKKHLPKAFLEDEKAYIMEKSTNILLILF